MKFHLLGCILLSSIIITSCSKSNDSTPPPPPPPPVVDTLTAGWTKAKINSFNGGGGDIFFVNNLTGYASDGTTGIYKTTDGGTTWNKILNRWATNIAATPDNKVFFVHSDRDSIYRTSDAGLTFDRYYLRAGDIFFSDNNTGLCSVGSNLYNTTNGGNSWNILTPFPVFPDRPSIFMFNNTTAWVVYGNKILHANGNLSTWKLDSISPAPTSTFGLCSVFAPSASIVYVSSYSGYIYKSTDGGNTFSFLTKLESYTTTGTKFSDLYFADNNTAFISVGNRLFKTTDGGVTWSMVVSVAYTSIIETHFTDATHGWAICNDGTVLKFN